MRLLTVLALGACTAPSAIEIAVDDVGVAHIYASSDADAWYGAGYQVATDRMFQMEMLRRFAHGRLSEVLGPAGLERDRQALIFDFPRWGEADRLATLEADPERAELIDAWVQGINARIEEVASGAVERPFGLAQRHYDFVPEPWTDADPYVVLKGANFALDKTLEFEIAISLVYQLYPDAIGAVQPLMPANSSWGIPPEDRPADAAASTGDAHVVRPPAIPLPEHPLSLELLDWPRPTGSNNWAIDGRHTASGRSLIAGDPHLGFDFFGAPYPLHVNSKDRGGTYDVVGFAYPGTPGIALGHNDKVAWTCTSAFADVMDVWRVQRQGGDVILGGQAYPITTRPEEIIVRADGAPVGEGESIIESFEDVEGLGAMLPPSALPLPVGDYLVGWSGFTARPARWFMELNRVQSIDEFEEAVGRMKEMNYNFVAADASDIAYRVGVDVPLRDAVDGERAPWKAMDGAQPNVVWPGGMLSADQMPHGRAPDRGWIGTANNDPFGFTSDGSVDEDAWYYGAFFAPGYRAWRIEEELTRMTSEGDLTIEDMKELQRDVHSKLADQLLPMLFDAASRVPDDPDLDAMLALLRSWDRRMTRDSTAALAMHAFARNLAADVLADDIPLAWDLAVQLKPLFMIKIAVLALDDAYPDASPILQAGKDAILTTAARRTGAWMRSRFGCIEDCVTWGDVKVTDFDHAYGFGIELFDVATDGGEDTLNVGQDILFHPDAETWATTHVSVERTVMEFAEDGTPSAQVNFPLAGPAAPRSEATEVAMDDYVNGAYRPLHFRTEDVRAAEVSRFEIER